MLEGPGAVCTSSYGRVKGRKSTGIFSLTARKFYFLFSDDSNLHMESYFLPVQTWGDVLRDESDICIQPRDVMPPTWEGGSEGKATLSELYHSVLFRVRVVWAKLH